MDRILRIPSTRSTKLHEISRSYTNQRRSWTHSVVRFEPPGDLKTNISSNLNSTSFNVNFLAAMAIAFGDAVQSRALFVAVDHPGQQVTQTVEPL